MAKSLQFTLFFIFWFQAIQIIFERIETGAPELLVLAYPIGYLVQFLEAGFVKSLPALLAHDDESTFREYLYMFVDRSPTDVKTLRYGIRIEGLAGDKGNDGSAGGVCYRLENVSSHIKGNLLVAN
jgi:hypothetical protein